MANVNETVTLTKRQMKKIEQAESAKGSLGKLPWWVDTIGYICIVGFALCVLFPLLLLIMVSVTDDVTLTLNGYSRYKSAKETSTFGNECGVKIVRNTDLMRLQLIFDGKPSDEVRAVLKKNAFKWSPKNSAWQRINTCLKTANRFLSPTV